MYPPPFQQPSAPPGGRLTRPNTVSMAAGLMIVVVFCQIIVAGMNAIILPRILRTYDQLGIGSMKTYFKVFYFGYNIVAIAVLVFYVFLAIAVLRGRNWARITTFVLAGLGALCCTCSGLSALGGGLNVSDQQMKDAGLGQLYPTWYKVSDGIVQAIVVLVLVAVIILLAVRPSGEFFAAVKARSQAALAAQAGYPGPPPGYPQSGPPGYGGYPPAGGYPGGPGY